MCILMQRINSSVKVDLAYIYHHPPPPLKKLGKMVKYIAILGKIHELNLM